MSGGSGLRFAMQMRWFICIANKRAVVVAVCKFSHFLSLFLLLLLLLQNQRGGTGRLTDEAKAQVMNAVRKGTIDRISKYKFD